MKRTTVLRVLDCVGVTLCFVAVGFGFTDHFGWATLFAAGWAGTQAAGSVVRNRGRR